MPWDPARDLLTMQERLESLFGHAAPGWVPPADLVESADEFRLTLELPGLDRGDIRIDFHEGTLTIRGRRGEDGRGPERYQQLERSRGPFTRSFQFGTGTMADGISADLADGILTVRVPKAAAARSQQIAVIEPRS